MMPKARDERDETAVAAEEARGMTPAARRALAEAAARHADAAQRRDRPPAEIDGRGGLDPVRYGDWEVKGLASDF